jgi:hypothetical protein
MADFYVLNVGILDADAVAVSAPKGLNDLAKGHLTTAKIGAQVEGGVEIVFPKTEGGELQLRVGWRAVSEWIKMRFKMADRPKRVD